MPLWIWAAVGGLLGTALMDAVGYGAVSFKLRWGG